MDIHSIGNQNHCRLTLTHSALTQLCLFNIKKVSLSEHNIQLYNLYTRYVQQKAIGEPVCLCAVIESRNLYSSKLSLAMPTNGASHASLISYNCDVHPILFKRELLDSQFPPFRK